MSAVGKDFLSRGVAYVSNIIAEEVSDVVSLRILNETQAEIRDDTHSRIFDRTVGRRREEIVEIAVSQVREIVANEQTQERIREGVTRMLTSTKISLPITSARFPPRSASQMSIACSE